jgi:hypothetical protein
MKITPTAVLELDLTVTGAARLSTYRLKCQGEWKDTGLEHTKLNFLQKHSFILKEAKIMKKYQLIKSLKYGYQLDKIGIIQIKLPNLTWIFGSQKGQQLMTALVQALINTCITTEKVFLWAAFPWCFQLR